MDYHDELYHIEPNEVIFLNKYQSCTIKNEKNYNYIPNISSLDNASNILDAPISPDKHEENTADIIPIITNGCQILISGKNK